MSGHAQLNFHQVPEHVSDDEDGTSFISSHGPAPVPMPRVAKHTRLTVDGSAPTYSLRTHYHDQVPSPVKVLQPPEPQQVWDNNYALDDGSGPPVDAAYVHHLGTVDLEPNPRVYTQAVSPNEHQRKLSPNNYQDTPLLHWIPDIDTCLQEILRHEGRGDHMHDTSCAGCKDGEPQYRCEDCHSFELYCSSCVVAVHARSPLHRILVGI